MIPRIHRIPCHGRSLVVPEPWDWSAQEWRDNAEMTVPMMRTTAIDLDTIAYPGWGYIRMGVHPETHAIYVTNMDIDCTLSREESRYWMHVEGSTWGAEKRLLEQRMLLMALWGYTHWLTTKKPRN